MTLIPVGRWAARILGALVGCGVLGVIVSEVLGPEPGAPPVARNSFEQALLVTIGISALALIAGWKHEKGAGILASTGGIVLLIAGVLYPDVRPLWPLGLLFLVPGTLYLTASAFSHPR
jgi:hypothetical protein